MTIPDDDPDARLIETLEAALEAEREARAKSESERDALMDLIVRSRLGLWTVTILPLTGTLPGGVVVHDVPRDEEFWAFSTREAAIAAVRKAAGLEDAR